MSIVTLKKKTEAQYNNMSVGQKGFSLNGTRRSAGYVGQDMLGRSLVRSLSRNGALKGHGGCCGKYPIHEIKTTPEMACLNDSAVVKSSSLNTNGLLMSRHRWIRRPQPFSTVKQDNTHNNNIQSSYIEYIARKAIVDGSNCHIVTDTVVKTCPTECPPVTKPDKFMGAINAEEYIRTITKKCTDNDDFKIPKTTQSLPFACR
jgi:hypothetical protein